MGVPHGKTNLDPTHRSGVTCVGAPAGRGQQPRFRSRGVNMQIALRTLVLSVAWLGLYAAGPLQAQGAEDLFPTSDATRQQVRQAVRQLGAAEYEAREAAIDRLIALSPASIAPLRSARESRDPEVALNARRALQLIELGVREDTPRELRPPALKLFGTRNEERTAAARKLRVAGPAGMRILAFLGIARPQYTEAGRAARYAAQDEMDPFGNAGALDPFGGEEPDRRDWWSIPEEVALRQAWAAEIGRQGEVALGELMLRNQTDSARADLWTLVALHMREEHAEMLLDLLFAEGESGRARTLVPLLGSPVAGEAGRPPRHHTHAALLEMWNWLADPANKFRRPRQVEEDEAEDDFGVPFGGAFRNGWGFSDGKPVGWDVGPLNESAPFREECGRAVLLRLAGRDEEADSLIDKLLAQLPPPDERPVDGRSYIVPPEPKDQHRLFWASNALATDFRMEDAVRIELERGRLSRAANLLECQGRYRLARLMRLCAEAWIPVEGDQFGWVPLPVVRILRSLLDGKHQTQEERKHFVALLETAMAWAGPDGLDPQSVAARSLFVAAHQAGVKPPTGLEVSLKWAEMPGATVTRHQERGCDFEADDAASAWMESAADDALGARAGAAIGDAGNAERLAFFAALFGGRAGAKELQAFGTEAMRLALRTAPLKPDYTDKRRLHDPPRISDFYLEFDYIQGLCQWNGFMGTPDKRACENMDLWFPTNEGALKEPFTVGPINNEDAGPYAGAVAERHHLETIPYALYWMQGELSRTYQRYSEREDARSESFGIYDGMRSLLKSPIDSESYQRAFRWLTEKSLEMSLVGWHRAWGSADDIEICPRAQFIRSLLLVCGYRGDVKGGRTFLATLGNMEMTRPIDVARYAGLLELSAGRQAAIEAMEAELRPYESEEERLRKRPGAVYMLGYFKKRNGDPDGATLQAAAREIMRNGPCSISPVILCAGRDWDALFDLYGEGTGYKRSVATDEIVYYGKSMRESALCALDEFAAWWQDHEQEVPVAALRGHYGTLRTLQAGRLYDALLGNSPSDVTFAFWADPFAGDDAYGHHDEDLVTELNSHLAGFSNYEPIVSPQDQALYEVAVLLNDLQHGRAIDVDKRCAQIEANAGGVHGAIATLVIGLDRAGRGALADAIADRALDRLRSCCELREPADVVYVNPFQYRRAYVWFASCTGRDMDRAEDMIRSGIHAISGEPFQLEFAREYFNRYDEPTDNPLLHVFWPSLLELAARRAYFRGDADRALELVMPDLLLTGGVGPDGVPPNLTGCAWVELFDKAARKQEP